MVGYILLGVAIVGFGCWLVRRQRSLKLRAHLMQEAIRNRDFTFRLPTDGLLPGEQAMQQTMNQMGETIRQLINQNEVESWERLTRVLTHEIMNATAPIASISQSMLSRPDVKGTPIEEAVETIYHTSQHLNNFIDSYRKLSQLQQPAIEDVRLEALLKDVSLLYPAVRWELRLADDAVVSADPSMMRQILINLVKNAIEAGADCIGCEYADGQLLVSNNGQPIPAEARQSIFVPFFTTKRTGSGIGLSLSRRMMIQQGGGMALSDSHRNGYATTFILEFQSKDSL
ncbi:MAG: HAMP domain-containing histidine kinase [Prevotella sp.]|nr:HAMP domain-containing histidine kinase [Prevotella sp.]